MNELRNPFNSLQKFDLGNGKEGSLYSLPALEEQLGTKLSRLPISIRVVLESLLRNCDGRIVQELLDELSGDSDRDT